MHPPVPRLTPHEEAGLRGSQDRQIIVPSYLLASRGAPRPFMRESIKTSSRKGRSQVVRIEGESLGTLLRGRQHRLGGGFPRSNSAYDDGLRIGSSLGVP